MIELLKKNHIALLLFLLFFAVYNLNMRVIPPADSLPTSLLPFELLESHNTDLDIFKDYIMANAPWSVTHYHGVLYSVYPVVLPVLITPIYLIPYLILKVINFPIDASIVPLALVMEKLCASLIASGAGVVLYLALRKILSERAALATSIIFAVCTSTWSTSSQNLWQHGLGELFLALLIYFILKDNISRQDAVIMGAVSGLLVFNRPPDSLLLLPIIFLMRKNIYYPISAAFAAAPFLILNLFHSGKIFGSYGYLAEGISLHNVANSIGLLVSPSRGILIYSPILILALVGFIISMGNKKFKSFIILAGISIILEILVYGSFDMWWAGGSYGPRFLSGSLPFWAMMLGFYLDTLKKTDWPIMLCIGALMAWSIFVQVVGAFYYPNGWFCCTPTDLELDPGRLWDWSDMEIFRTFNAGIWGQ